jgi:hypothetical protein
LKEKPEINVIPAKQKPTWYLSGGNFFYGAKNTKFAKNNDTLRGG